MTALSHLLPAHLPGHVIFDWDLTIPGISMACQSDLRADAALLNLPLETGFPL